MIFSDGSLIFEYEPTQCNLIIVFREKPLNGNQI